MHCAPSFTVEPTSVRAVPSLFHYGYLGGLMRVCARARARAPCILPRRVHLIPTVLPRLFSQGVAVVFRAHDVTVVAFNAFSAFAAFAASSLS